MSVDGGEPTRSAAELALDRGERHHAAGRLEDAEQAYFEAACEAADSEAADSTPDGAGRAPHVLPRARIGLGRIELSRGSPDRALGWFLSARDVAPDAWEPLYWRGCAQGRLADHHGAQQSFTAALRLNPGDSSTLIQRSYARFALGDLAAALDDLLAAQRASSLNETALVTLASLRLARKEWAEAETVLRPLLDTDPPSVRANELMGAAQEWQDRPAEALDWYRRAAESGEVSPSTCGRLGVLHARAGRAEVALPWLRRAGLAKSPDDQVLYYSGWVSGQLGDFQDSIDAWTTLQRRHTGLELDGPLAMARHGLARERLAAQDYDAASEHLRAAAALVPEDQRFPFLLALIEWAQGTPHTALPMAMALGRMSRPARLAVVRCALEAGDGDAAQRQVLRIAPRPSQQVEQLARCLGAQRWSDAADLLRTGAEPDLAAELLGHCLALAGRHDELDLSSSGGARAGLLHGLASADRGELDTARSMLAAVARVRPDLAGTALGHVDRLRALRAVEAGSWQDAPALLAGSSSADGQLAPAPLLEGLILLVAGDRGPAGGYLEEALRADPTNPRVLQAVSAAWLTGGPDTIEVRTGIAAMGALLGDDGFWERFRSGAASRYQATITTAALAECRRTIERRASARAGPGHDVLLLRETAAASALRALGGFPAGSGDDTLICGPLMISLLGLERAWGEFVARQRASDDSAAGQWRQLRQLFSGLGAATALLTAERPGEALAALEAVACEDCRAITASMVCAATCPGFDTRHPSYARLPGKGRRLAEDAAWLVIAAQLGVARRLVATGSDDVGAAIRLWEGAISAAALVGTQEQTHRQIADTVLGRAKVLLNNADRLSAAITLLEAGERVLAGSPAREELRGQLGQLLTDRGVIAANYGRLEYALSDLRRAVSYSPHSPRPIINLSRALQRRADEQVDRKSQYESLREAKRMLESAASELSGSPEFGQQLNSVRKELKMVCNGWAVELAKETRHLEALEVLGRGLAELPGLPADDPLRISQQNIRMAMRNRGRTGS